MSNLKSVAEKAADLGQEVKESVQELGEEASRKLLEFRKSAEDVLQSVAASVREGSVAVEGAASNAAKKLGTARACIEDYRKRDLGGGIQKFCRDHVTEIVVGSAIVGFIAGSAYKRTVHSRA